MLSCAPNQSRCSIIAECTGPCRGLSLAAQTRFVQVCRPEKCLRRLPQQQRGYRPCTGARLFPTLVRLTPVQLQLSGHSHADQVRIPGFGPLILPEWGQVYHTGLYELDGRMVYTGRGLGLVELPMRFACPPELTEITLTQRDAPGAAARAL